MTERIGAPATTGSVDTAIDGFLANPAAARDLLATRLQEAWQMLVAPFWVRVRTMLDRDIEHRSRTLARHETPGE